MAVSEEKKEARDGLIEIREMKTAYSDGEAFYINKAVFKRGEITAVIGKNGCGKTTLLKAMAGIMPYSGSIAIDKRECREYRRRERALKIAYLPQLVKPAHMDVRTLAEHGRFPWHGNYRRLSDEDRARVDWALELARMDGFGDRELTELSGGELRRAYLSMVIAQDTDMLLLDEPTTFMDIENQILFFKIIRELADKGRGVVFTSHNMEQSFSYSDSIVIMEDRAVRSAGSPEALARDGEVLREVFGASVKKTDDKGLLYPYVLTK